MADNLQGKSQAFKNNKKCNKKLKFASNGSIKYIRKEKSTFSLKKKTVLSLSLNSIKGTHAPDRVF